MIFEQPKNLGKSINSQQKDFTYNMQSNLDNQKNYQIIHHQDQSCKGIWLFHSSKSFLYTNMRICQNNPFIIDYDLGFRATNSILFKPLENPEAFQISPMTNTLLGFKLNQTGVSVGGAGFPNPFISHLVKFLTGSTLHNPLEKTLFLYPLFFENFFNTWNFMLVVFAIQSQILRGESQI